jgi:LmbE family N-acetylglucosaminyl deacetylase
VEKYLFVGAHPDDIEFGAGATLAKAVEAGIECHTIVFSNCAESLNIVEKNENLLISESQQALKILGVNPANMHWFNHKVRNFGLSRQEILQTLIDQFISGGWDRIFIPNTKDIHQDHAVISQECARAFKFSTLLGYELPWNNYESQATFYNVLAETSVSRKLEALEQFASQRNRFYASSKSIKSVLQFRGLQVQCDFAEAFQVIRMIEH